MDRHFAALVSRPLPARSKFCEPASTAPSVSLEDPATSVMTDLKLVTAVTIDPAASIDHAMRVMVRRNVRLLFVVNIDNEIDGLLTATDVLGEKPLQHLQEHGGRRSDIQVRDVMTPQSEIEVLSFDEIASARVGHVLATLEQSRRQHALVADSDALGRPVVRGILSASQLAQQIGRSIQAGLKAFSFAEIQAALGR